MKNKIKKLNIILEKIENEVNLSIIIDFLDWFKEKLNLHFLTKSPNLILKKWDIYYIKLGQNIWSELNKTRPCLVYSIKKANFWNTVIIIPLKSYKNTKINTFQKIIKKDRINNLEKDSIIDITSIKQISKKRILTKIGKISKNYLLEIDLKILEIFWIKK